MKDGTGNGEPAVLRQDVYEDYVKCYVQERAEIGPCRDPLLLKKAAQYLLNEAEAAATFTVFPFYQAVTEGCGAPGAAFRKHLSAFIRAAELLETLCVNLFLQPWKKEIRTLKVPQSETAFLPVLLSPSVSPNSPERCYTLYYLTCLEMKRLSVRTY